MDNDPIVLVVTPLLPNHKISGITRKTIKRNDIPIAWVSYTGNNNIPTNTQNGINEYLLKYQEPPFFLMLDNDIELGRYMIDRMVDKLSKSKVHEAYCYASFEFKGFITTSFPAIDFNIGKLLQHNYISSNSLIKLDCLRFIGGMVTDDTYRRLLDWCLFLKLLLHGYIGIPCPEAHFIAHSTEDSISAGGPDDYRLKHQRVYNDFIRPILTTFSRLDAKT